MTIPHTRRLVRRPIHPGEILREEFLPDYGLSVSALATAIGVSRSGRSRAGTPRGESRPGEWGGGRAAWYVEWSCPLHLVPSGSRISRHRRRHRLRTESRRATGR